MNTQKKKVLLAFSGGLDTSYCAIYLNKEMGFEVYTAAVNTGGFSGDEKVKLAQKAKDLGMEHHVCLEQEQVFYEKGIRFLVYGNVLKNHTYPLSVSSERAFQAMALVDYAREIGADAIAHGSTGAGNDQVRFDSIFQVLAPELEIITPVRDQSLSREEEVAYLKENGIEMNWEKAKYSINKGLWGTSVGGAETLTSDQPLPEEAWPTAKTANESQKLKLHFSKGEISGINDEEMDPVQAIRHLENLAGPYGIGRDIHVGDTIIGIKGRVGFEAASPLIIIKGHQLLEKHVLGKWQLYWKDQLSDWYGMMMHEAQYLDPVMRDIEAFLEHSQQMVSGTVYVQLKEGRFELEGIESENDLMASGFGQYGETTQYWTGEDVKGFTKILSNSTLIQQKAQHHD